MFGLGEKLRPFVQSTGTVWLHEGLRDTGIVQTPPHGFLTRLLLFFLLIVEVALPACKSAPHRLRGLVQTSVIKAASKVSHTLSLFAHGRVLQVFARFVRLSGLCTCNSVPWHGIHSLHSSVQESFPLGFRGDHTTHLHTSLCGLKIKPTTGTSPRNRIARHLRRFAGPRFFHD